MKLLKTSSPGGNRLSKRGFTLVEIMFTLLIFGFVATGLAQFMLSTSRMLYDSALRTDLNSDMRSFTQTIMQDAQTADAYYVYNSFIGSDRSDIAGADRLGADKSGDFILFVYTEPQPDTNSTVYITKLVGYFRKQSNINDVTSRGPICRFVLNYADQTIPAATSVIETLISSQNYGSTYPILIPYATGRYNNRLFYNPGTSCVMIGAEFYQGSVARSSTEIYRLTINP